MPSSQHPVKTLDPSYITLTASIILIPPSYHPNTICTLLSYHLHPYTILKPFLYHLHTIFKPSSHCNLFYQIYYIYSSLRKSFQVTTKHSLKEGLQLPSVALCNRGIFSRYKLEELNVSADLANYMMMLAASPWIGNPKLFKTTEGQVRLAILQEQFENLLEVKKMNATQIIDRVSLDCEEMIVHCTFNDEEIHGRDCCRMFTPVPTFSGKCYVLFANESFSQAFSGEMGGLIITLLQVKNDEPALVKGILDPSKWLKRKLQITLLNNVTHPSLEVVGHGPMITPNTLLSMQVSLQTIDNVQVKQNPDWRESECVKVKDIVYGASDDFYFTEGNCMTAIYRECSAELCGCSSYFQDNLQLSSKLCSVNKSNDCINRVTAFMTREVTSRCRRVCNLSSFKTSTVGQPLPSYQMTELKERFGLQEQDVLTLVTIFYPLLEYEEVFLSRKSYGDLLSNLGGSTGVFLGFSFITLMECFIFFIFCLNAAFRKFLCLRKKSAAKTAVAPPERTNKSAFSLHKSACDTWNASSTFIESSPSLGEHSFSRRKRLQSS
ncbi:uncharacterized protein LOC119575460 isoform X2 [Penaeus monodon]|uniref:uncharacterized protein LOC119575460 isoform X2 n=1 Tax=Penaeus monodon TaxID=6687 RepID=UPI0018A6DA29|nr:uncharacterized protein LOC119575460 isoform X2 [Penaeus monodon]